MLLLEGQEGRYPRGRSMLIALWDFGTAERISDAMGIGVYENAGSDHRIAPLPIFEYD